MLKIKTLAILGALTAAAGANAQTVKTVTQTYAGPTANGIDEGATQNFDFDVDATGEIAGLAISVTTGGPYADDVTFSLSHLGTTVTFYDGHGDTLDSQIDATFTDAATQAAPNNGSATGTLLPASPFSAFDGLDAAGKYTLSTIDYVLPGDGTKLLASSLTLTTTVLAGPTAAVPEAATWAMMMVGLGVVGGALRRRSDAKFDAKVKRIADGLAA